MWKVRIQFTFLGKVMAKEKHPEVKTRQTVRTPVSLCSLLYCNSYKKGYKKEREKKERRNEHFQVNLLSTKVSHFS